MRILGIALITLLLFPSVVPAEQNHAERAYKEWMKKNWMTRYARDVDDMIRSRLFAHCRPMKVTVYRYKDEEGNLPQLEKAHVSEIVNSHLSHYNLYSKTGKSFVMLDIGIQTRRVAFAVNMQLKKMIFEPASNYITFATTWNRTLLGEHRGDHLVVLFAVKAMTDNFIDSYRKANQSCWEKREVPLRNKR